MPNGTKVVLAATVATAASWSSNPTSILLAIAVIALIWLVGRSMRRSADALQSLRERMVADHTRLEEQLDTRLKPLGERFVADPPRASRWLLRVRGA